MASSEEVWVVMKVLDWTVRSAKEVKDILMVLILSYFNLMARRRKEWYCCVAIGKFERELNVGRD